MYMIEHLGENEIKCMKKTKEHKGKYNKCVIYMIWSDMLNKGYIGSTRYFTQRRATHGHHYRRYCKNGKSYCRAFEILGLCDNRFIILEELSCENRTELESKERYWIQKYTTEVVNIKKKNATKI